MFNSEKSYAKNLKMCKKRRKGEGEKVEKNKKISPFSPLPLS